MRSNRYAWRAIGVGCLVALTALPLPASASVLTPTAISAPGPSHPGSPGHRPKPPAPPVRVPTAWPLRAGDQGPLVAQVQQRLIWLGLPVRPTRVMDPSTVTAVVRFRSKFGLGTAPVMSARAWSVLTSVTRARGALPSSCRSESLVLCVDKTQKSLRLVRRGRVLLTVDARFGGVGTPTREGSFRIFRKSRDHVSTLFHTSMPFAMFFSGGQAVHYSPYFHQDGYAGASHGCVNLRDKAVAASLFSLVPVGTRVVVYRS